MHRSALMSESLAKAFHAILRDSPNGNIRKLARTVRLASEARGAVLADLGVHVPQTVSYTHLTLPTN